MTNISRYTNGHLFSLYDERTALVTQIGKVLGGLTDDDYADFDLFASRVERLGDVASESNCHLYVDAEQTFI